ncbi:hypothetical protein EB796_016000 [Bugula neritina]|uniref:Uncharacterized protein n=1 Tax=Bugula neritina TaxID=10212 RepID=A0A7J7JHD4_BUGNE|nr:hypothetical protein EB796_016000 [Bugula neritina]
MQWPVIIIDLFMKGGKHIATYAIGYVNTARLYAVSPVKVVLILVACSQCNDLLKSLCKPRMKILLELCVMIGKDLI